MNTEFIPTAGGFKIGKKVIFDDMIYDFSVTGNVLSVSGGDNNVSLWRQLPDGTWKCISDADAEALQ